MDKKWILIGVVLLFLIVAAIPKPETQTTEAPTTATPTPTPTSTAPPTLTPTPMATVVEASKTPAKEENDDKEFLEWISIWSPIISQDFKFLSDAVGKGDTDSALKYARFAKEDLGYVIDHINDFKVSKRFQAVKDNYALGVRKSYEGIEKIICFLEGRCDSSVLEEATAKLEDGQYYIKIASESLKDVS